MHFTCYLHFQVSTGEVNWDYDWNNDMPYISPGMVEGKEPLLDEWEVSQSNCRFFSQYRCHVCNYMVC